MHVKNFIKDFLPPVFLRLIRKGIASGYQWSGNYATWAEAKNKSTGYESGVILEKTKDSLLKVKNGEAVYERDSVLSDNIQYSYPVLTALLWIAANEEGSLNIIDFGGSLGSGYFQNRVFLNTLRDVKWNIVEQKHFVDCGKEHFENQALKFYDNVDDCLSRQRPDAILFSGVIQYLQKPYELLRGIVNKGFKYIIVDRTSFNHSFKDKLVIQKVGKKIFCASYPCWFLNIKEFKKIFEPKYSLIDEFISFENTDVPSDPVLKGFIYKAR